MAFIRQFAAESGDPVHWMGDALMGYEGDPGRFRIPKRVRRFKPGRSLGGVAKLAMRYARYAPIVGSSIGLAQDLTGFEGDPGPKHSKLAHASAPPSHHAAKKSHAHAKKLHGAAAAAHAKKRGGGLAGLASSIGGAAAGLDAFGAAHPGLVDLASGAAGGIPLVGGIASGLIHRGLGTRPADGGTPDMGADAAAAFGGPLRGRSAHGFGRHRRKNVLNPKALSRAFSRIEGFEKFARRVVPRLFRVTGKPGHGHHTFHKRKRK